MNHLKKNQYTAIFTSFKGCGKSILLLDLIEREYNKHLDYSIIIYPTLRQNKRWWNHLAYCYINNREVAATVSIHRNTVYHWWDYWWKRFNKQIQPLLKLAVSGRHLNHLLYLLVIITYGYHYLKRQVKVTFVWYPKERQILWW